MPEPETPAALLRRAAETLREYAEVASRPSVAAWAARAARVAAPNPAAMHPGVGLALAAWLDEAAVDAETIGPEPKAEAVARQILGEVSE